MSRSTSLWRHLHAVTAVTLAAISFFIPELGYAVRPHDTASFISPHSEVADAFFNGPDYLFAGGVVPHGQATFQTDNDKQISPKELTIVFNADKFGVKPDRDAIQIHWNSQAFTLPIPDQQIAPLIRFIEADRTIAYTIPAFQPTELYVQQSGLRSVLGDAYVAEQLSDPALVKFLDSVDLYTNTEALEPKLERQIISSVVGNERENERLVLPGSYVNADFHVTYKAYLVADERGNHVDIAGLPLRYHWDVGSSQKAVISGVEVFAFPKNKQSLQYEAVLFFQNAAVLRQYKVSNPAGFKALLKDVNNVTKEQ